MFRRRPFRRRMLTPAAPRRQVAIRRLQRAHQLMKEGSFSEANDIFENLASGAAERDNPRAPHLFLQAGNAALKAGDHTKALSLFSHGLRLMDKMGQIRRLPAASQRVLEELQSLGLEAEREALESEVSQLLAGRNLELNTTAQQQKNQLPGKCSQCGGTVHPKEVEWIDGTTASCDYCGSMLKAS